MMKKKKRTMKMEEMYKYKEKKRTKSEMSTQKKKKKMKKRTKTKRRKRKEVAGWLGEGQFRPQYTFSPFSLAFSPQFGRLSFGGSREKIAGPLHFSLLLPS